MFYRSAVQYFTDKGRLFHENNEGRQQDPHGTIGVASIARGANKRSQGGGHFLCAVEPQCGHKKACLSAPSKLGDSVSIQGSLLGFLLQYAFHALRYHVPVLRSTHVRWRCAFLCGLQTEPVKAFRHKTWWPRLHDARIPFSRPLELAFSNPAAFRKRSER